MRRKKAIIRYITVMGDSLSDQGISDKRKILGCIPMAKLAGLSGKSPNGRFTNGASWEDYLAAMLENHFLGKDPGEISATIENNFEFDDPNITSYQGNRFIEMYSEGGLSSFDYKGTITLNVMSFFSRLVLRSLEQYREKLIEDDAAFRTNEEEKAETLIIDWTGANDLVTMSPRPTFDAADRAVRAKQWNAITLIENHYKNFYYFNLPDLSLTPDYQKKSEEERLNAKEITLFFNERLKFMVERLALQYPDCRFHLFDVNSKFTNIYNNPEEYGFEKEKLTQAFTESTDFVDSHSPAPGYMYWDGKHPTTHGHRLIAEHFFESMLKKFKMKAPPALDDIGLSNLFKEAYLLDFKRAKSSHFGVFRRSNLHFPAVGLLPLVDILRHGLYEGGGRTKKVLMSLEWIDKNNRINPDIPTLVAAKIQLDNERRQLKLAV